MHKHLNVKFALMYVLIGVALVGAYALAGLSYTLPHPSDSRIATVAKRELGDLNTERIATAFVSDQAAANDIHVVSIKKLRVTQKDPNTLVYRFQLVGISDIYGKLTFVIDVTVKKGVYQPAGLKVISSR